MRDVATCSVLAMPSQINPAAVRSIRQIAGISARELSRRCDLHPRTMTNIELGKHSVKLVTLRRIADELGVPLAAITTDAAEPESTLA